jgi:hypothetical protein
MESELKKFIDSNTPASKHTENRSSDRNTQTREPLRTALLTVLYCLQPALRWYLRIVKLDSDTVLSEEIFRSACESNYNQ